MNLKALFEGSVLTEETQAVVQEAFDTAIAAKEVELQEQYNEKLEEAKNEMANATAELVQEAVDAEMDGIVEELAEARNLEVTYATKLEQFKESYAEAKDAEAKELIEEMVAEEIGKLHESIELAKKNEFMLQVFEQFQEGYTRLFGQPDMQGTIEELKEAKAELDNLKREQKLGELLESVSGAKRKVAQTILESTPTDKLEARFEAIKDVLLSESDNTTNDDVVT